MFGQLKKKVHRTNVLLGEKFGSRKAAADPGEEYKKLCTRTDNCKKFYEDLKKRSLEYVQPSSTILPRPPMPSRSEANSNKNEEFAAYPEQRLADCFSKYGSTLPESDAFAGLLKTTSTSFQHIAEARHRAIEETKTGVVFPLRDTLNQDIKELLHMRNAAEKHRLTFEYERKKVDKGTILEENPVYLEAKKCYEEKLGDSEAAMISFHDSEEVQAMTINNLVSALLSYHQDAVRALSDLQSTIQKKTGEIASKPKSRPAQVKRNTSSHSGASSTSPTVHHISKQSDGLKQTPTCKALFDFEAENPFELSFSEGDILMLIEKVDENWYLGSLNGVEGHFPTNYVEVLVPLP